MISGHSQYKGRTLTRIFQKGILFFKHLRPVILQETITGNSYITASISDDSTITESISANSTITPTVTGDSNIL